MKIVCYFADAPGSHPDVSTADYDKIWPVMQQSVEAQGYQLIHVTSKTDRARADKVVRLDIDPLTVMFSRELAWLHVLLHLGDDEQAVLIEPDCVLRKPIPPLAAGYDALLLSRPGRPMPSGFRIARKRALPFYQAVVDHYRTLSPAKKAMHGDVDSAAAVLGINRDCVTALPCTWKGVRFEHRDWIDYTSKLWRRAVAWNFKGWSKRTMLEMADGKEPQLR